MRRGLEAGVPRPAPVRRWGCAAGERWSWRRRVPLLRDGRFANRPYDGVWGSWQCDGGLVVGRAPSRAPGYRLSPVRRW